MHAGLVTCRYLFSNYVSLVSWNPDPSLAFACANTRVKLIERLHVDEIKAWSHSIILVNARG